MSKKRNEEKAKRPMQSTRRDEGQEGQGSEKQEEEAQQQRKERETKLKTGRKTGNENRKGKAVRTEEGKNV